MRMMERKWDGWQNCLTNRQEKGIIFYQLLSPYCVLSSRLW